MNSVILSKSYQAPPVCQKDILRYAACRHTDEVTLRLLRECIDEAEETLSYMVCYRELRVKVNGSVCDFEAFRWESEKLASNLKDCERVVIFAATIGVGIDRLIAKYGRISPSKAFLLGAFGTERIESLCDIFCRDLEKEYGVALRPRFSPGYGDLSLEAQREIFSLLDCEKRIGLTLTDSLLMSPSKSVTAIVGIGGDKKTSTNKCSNCNLTDCTFRGAL